MPRVDFKPDVDGFAFKNDWSFDEREKEEIREIARQALPIAAAALTPIVMAAAPMIAPIAGLALGPVLPLVAAAGPFLFAAAPKISEMIVEAVTNKIAKGNDEDDLCGGMTAAALDYHRLGWLPPRGNSSHDNPQFDPNNPDSVESQLRRRIWNGQLESHIDNSPTVVLWKAVASVFGDWGHAWLRDRTREELNKISAGLAAGQAQPIGIVWTDVKKSPGHIVVAYALDWHGQDQCSLTIYDNEKPDKEVFFDIDLSQVPAIIIDRASKTRSDGIFLGSFRPKTPPPAVVLSSALTFNPSNYIVHGEPLDASFEISNIGFGDVPDGEGGLRSGAFVKAPAMSWLLPTKAAASSATPVPDLSRIAVATEEMQHIDASNLPEGLFFLEPVIMAGSLLSGSRVPRRLPHADGSPAAAIPFRVNPRISIRNRHAHSGFGCARMLIEGDHLELEADVSAVAGRGIVSITWTVAGALTFTAHGSILVIDPLPQFPQHCDVFCEVELGDGTKSRNRTSVYAFPEDIVDRNQHLCELSHLLMRIPLSRFNPDVLINPVRYDEAVRKISLPDPRRVVGELQRALDRFGREK